MLYNVYTYIISYIHVGFAHSLQPEGYNSRMPQAAESSCPPRVLPCAELPLDQSINKCSPKVKKEPAQHMDKKKTENTPHCNHLAAERACA